MEPEDAPDARAAASMAAFDKLPKRFRRFCAEYPRTTSGQNLRRIYEEGDRKLADAQTMLRYHLPTGGTR
jgi:hypothetical protein